MVKTGLLQSHPTKRRTGGPTPRCYPNKAERKNAVYSEPIGAGFLGTHLRKTNQLLLLVSKKKIFVLRSDKAHLVSPRKR